MANYVPAVRNRNIWSPLHATTLGIIGALTDSVNDMFEALSFRVMQGWISIPRPVSFCLIGRITKDTFGTESIRP